jgi:hypothetical protein
MPISVLYQLSSVYMQRVFAMSVICSCGSSTRGGAYDTKLWWKSAGQFTMKITGRSRNGAVHAVIECIYNYRAPTVTEKRDVRRDKRFPVTAEVTCIHARPTPQPCCSPSGTRDYRTEFLSMRAACAIRDDIRHRTFLFFVWSTVPWRLYTRYLLTKCSVFTVHGSDIASGK